MIRQTLTLDYRLPAGWLTPWVEGILAGRALGRKCEGCGRVSFVPLRYCDCGENAGSWVELPGTATVNLRTEGADGAFGLVTFDGAATQTTARLQNFENTSRRGQLVKPASDHPALVLRPISDEVID